MKSLKNLPKPRGAWLLIGDEASYGTRLYDCWTSSPLVEKGDILFIYFMKPRQTEAPYQMHGIHYIARALDRPYVDPKIRVNAVGDVSKYQWLVRPSKLIAVQPIPYSELCECMGEMVNLRGRSGKYVSPDVANRLLSRVKTLGPPSKAETRETLRRVVGRSDLPNQKKMTIGDWRGIPSGLLRLEKEVERYIVDPLLRFCKVDGCGLAVLLQHRVGNRIADFVIFAGEEPKCVIEVKQRINFPAGNKGKPESSPDYQQLRDYVRELKCPSLLIDCDQILLFSNKEMRLLNRFERGNLGNLDLAVIARHIGVVAKRSNGLKAR